MPLKENLKQLRIEHKVKQKDLAQYLGISSIAVANYENGRSQPDLDTAKKIADFFHITIDELIAESYHLKKPEENN